MKATVQIPDEVYLRVMSRSALLGRSVVEVTTALYRQWLGDQSSCGREPASESSWINHWASLGAQFTPADSAVTPTARQILSDDRSRLDTGEAGR